MPPQENAKTASKLLISLEQACRKWRELSNSGVLCAAGYNIRWLLRLIVKKAEPFFTAVAGHRFDRFEEQTTRNLLRELEQLRVDELCGGLKVDISGTTKWR